MGKFKSKRKNNFKEAKDPEKKLKPHEEPYRQTDYVKENAAFENFYKLQLKNEFKDESEFRAFMNIMRERLPITFRVNENVPNYQNFINKITDSEFLSKLLEETSSEQNQNENPIQKELTDETKKISEQLKLEKISWYPRDLVWQLNIFRHELKKNKAFQALHKLIQDANESGLITRQELVSMIPPLLLDIKSTDIICDMCAAPGSKTGEMLELLYRDETNGEGLTTGGVLANDADYARAKMLIHQVKRLSTAGMMVTNHQAQYFPGLIEEKIEGKEPKKFYFDKILADVPCTGDGAIRKIPGKWQKWTVRDGTSLHALQLQILMRALQIVKVGGLILYSTCSINPIEDEAVITELFRKSNEGAFELIDIAEALPGLKTRRGMHKWVVCDPKEQKKGVEEEKVSEGSEKKESTDFFNIYESADQLPEGYLGLVRPSMFPDSEEKMRDVYKIHNTIRLLPHDQNTGGFYLALIRKNKEINYNQKTTEAKSEEKVKNLEEELIQEEKAIKELDEQTKNIPKDFLVEEDPESKNVKNVKDDDGVEGREEEEDEGATDAAKDKIQEESKTSDNLTIQKPERKKKKKYCELTDEEWDWIQDHYGFKDQSLKQLFIQQTEGEKRILFVSPGIKKIRAIDIKTSIVKLNLGVKALQRNREVFLQNKCPFRICQDAVPSLFPFMTKRTVKCSVKEFIFIFQSPSIKYQDIPDEELRNKLKALGLGSFVLYCEGEAPILKRECIAMLNHPNSVTPMASKEVISALKLKYL